jgi:hypothetical protein
VSDFDARISKYVLMLFPSVPPSAYLPLQCVMFEVSWLDFWLSSSHKVGRMMMNIRGLIMDDPEHTIHLQTLQFVARTNPGSDTEEIALG